MNQNSSRFLTAVGLTLFFLALSFLYLWPASLTLWNGEVAGRGYDDSNLLFQYWGLREVASHSFLTLFNPALFTLQAGFPEGQVLWFPVLEKFLIALTPHSVPLTALPILHLLVIHLLNLFCSYWCARKYEFNRGLALVFAVGFSLIPYVYFRSQMHHALAGIYAYPLFLIAAKEIARPRKAGLLFLAALTSAHYYYFGFILFFPTAFLVLKGYRQENFKNWAMAAIIPALFLGVTKLGYVYDPLHLREKAVTRPVGETAWSANPKDRAWDVLVYSARPVDYLAGNYEAGKTEWNLLRKKLSEWNMNREGNNFYAQERSSSIRWIILILVALLWIKRKELSPQECELARVALAVAAVFFIFSLSPRAIAPLGRGIMPSQFFHQLFGEMRAANRFSIGVHLGLGILAVLSLKVWFSQKSYYRFIPWVFLLVYLIDNLPTFAFPTHPEGSSLVTRGVDTDVRGNCGVGIHYPYYARDDIRSYRTQNEMRESDCRLLTNTNTIDFENWITTGMQKNRRATLACLNPNFVILEAGYSDEAFEKELVSLGYSKKGNGFYWKSSPTVFSWDCYLKERKDK